MSANKSKPQISVIMPVFNSALFLNKSIESILNQSFKNFEFIIIDDGSTDTSLSIINSYSLLDKRIKLVKNKINYGICHTLNRGLLMAKGQYVARMDADDWSYPDRLLKQLQFMKSHTEVVICGGDIDVCNKNLAGINTRQYPTSDKKIREKIFRLNPFAHSAVIYKKNIVLSVGGYNKNFAGAEDYELYFRLGKVGKFANLSQKLLKLRTHSSSISAKSITRQAKLNLYLRLKAAMEYGYKFSLLDKLFLCFNILGIWLIPSFMQFTVFNFFRRFQK